MNRDFQTNLKQYEAQIQRFKDYVHSTQTETNKFSLISHAVSRKGDLCDKQRSNLQQVFLSSVRKRSANCDMQLIVLIRLMFLLNEEENSSPHAVAIVDEVREALRSFPFWPPDSDHRCKKTQNLIYWSENHLFMTLTSAYLFYQLQARRQRIREGGASSPSMSRFADFEENFIECRLLKTYLDIHLHRRFQGSYELNSHGYLHFTLAALLNLLDFAESEEMREKARRLIELLSIQAMLGTDPLMGVVSFSVGAREYDRNRLRAFHQSLSPLVTLMNDGHCIDTHAITILTDFLLTTTWRPSQAAFDALYFEGFSPNTSLNPSNHRLDELSEVYGRPIQRNYCCGGADEETPLYWSGGLLVHPDMLCSNTAFVCQRGQCCNKQLCFLPLLPVASCCCSLCCCIGCSARQLNQLLRGQLYMGMRMMVYKRPRQGLLLSSFHLFNPHITGFQQVPWFGNLCGVPMWSQSGSGKERVFHFNIGVFNTHNPAVQQQAHLLLVSYLTPDILLHFPLGRIFAHSSRFFWPQPFFDKHVLHEYGVISSSLSSSDPTAIEAIDRSSPLKTIGYSKLQSNEPYEDSSRHGDPFPSTAHQKLLRSREGRVWCVGQRKGIFVAVLCTQPVTVDTSRCKDAAFATHHEAAEAVMLPRLCCEARYHSWVVALGTDEEFESLEDFINRRLRRIEITESLEDRVYLVKVRERRDEEKGKEKEKGEEERVLTYCYDIAQQHQIGGAAEGGGR